MCSLRVFIFVVVSSSLFCLSIFEKLKKALNIPQKRTLRHDMCKILLEGGADVNMLPETSLHETIDYKYNRTSLLLIKNGIDVNLVRHEKKRTALMLAARDTNCDVLEALLKHSANVNSVDKDGLSAIDRVVSQNGRNGNKRFCMLQLLCYGAYGTAASLDNSNSWKRDQTNVMRDVNTLVHGGTVLGKHHFNSRELDFIDGIAFGLAMRLPGAIAWKVFTKIHLLITFNGIFMCHEFRLQMRSERNVWDPAPKR